MRLHLAIKKVIRHLTNYLNKNNRILRKKQRKHKKMFRSSKNKNWCFGSQGTNARQQRSLLKKEITFEQGTENFDKPKKKLDFPQQGHLNGLEGQLSACPEEGYQQPPLALSFGLKGTRFFFLIRCGELKVLNSFSFLPFFSDFNLIFTTAPLCNSRNHRYYPGRQNSLNWSRR